jgi:hypothetical protein
MLAVLWQIVWRLALCGAVSWAAWRVFGSVAMVTSLPLFGILLAKPLIDLASDLRHQARVVTWHAVEGRYFAFHDVPVQVLEDESFRRWVRAADVRRIVGFTASDGALALTYPSGWRSLGVPAQPHFSDDALLAHLAKESAPVAAKFRQWAEREIAYPARQLRLRHGIRIPAPTQAADD